MRLPIEWGGGSLVIPTPVAALEPLLAFVCLWELVGWWKLARRDRVCWGDACMKVCTFVVYFYKYKGNEHCTS